MMFSAPHDPIGIEQFRRAKKFFAKDQVIFEEGAEASSTWWILSGWVRLQVTTADGVRKIVAFMGPGDTFGALTGHNHVTAETVTPVTLRSFDAASLRRLITEQPEAAIQLLSDRERRYDELSQHLHQVLHLPAPERLLCFLASLAAKAPADPATGFTRLPMSREDISDFLGIASATLSRLFTRFRDEGRLSLSGPRNFALRMARPILPHCRAAGDLCMGCLHAEDSDRATTRTGNDLGTAAGHRFHADPDQPASPC